VRSLTDYDFTSNEARERFEELLESLRQQIVQSYLDQMAGDAAATGPEECEHIRNALDALNTMMEQRAAGESLDPSFEQFMESYGDLFPGNPEDLDALLAQLAQRMAAASAMLASMTPGQRAQLQELMNELLSDMDLSWQVNRLAGNLRGAFPGEQWDRAMPSAVASPWGWPRPPTCSSALASSTSSRPCCRDPRSPGRSPKSISIASGTCSATRLRRRCHSSRDCRAASRSPVSSSNARVGSSSPREVCGASASGRSTTSSSTCRRTVSAATASIPRAWGTSAPKTPRHMRWGTRST